MTTREDQPPDVEGGVAGAPRDQRPIPDGGLGSAMPAWLQQPPAWKRQGPPVPARTIPPPDTSIIDPRTMLDVDDLPQWLRAVALRETAHSAPVSDDRMPGSEQRLETAQPVLTGNAPPMTSPNAPQRPHETVEKAKASSVTPESGIQPWWMSNSVIGGLFVAIILTMLYVIAVASGVL